MNPSEGDRLGVLCDSRYQCGKTSCGGVEFSPGSEDQRKTFLLFLHFSENHCPVVLSLPDSIRHLNIPIGL